MNLKYYLRGLGLGMLVTALILGLSGHGKQTMTDAEVKERALELGMIENTVLAEIDEQEKEEAVSLPEEPEEDVQETEKETGEAASEEPQAKEPEAAEERPAQDDEEVQENETETVQSEEETERPGTEDTGADTEAEEPSQTVQDGDQMTGETDKAVVLTVVHGDSSYSVAKKLYDMGVVPSAEEYDRYLCQNGYDRGIRTGTYEIEAGTPLEQIARMINGK